MPGPQGAIAFVRTRLASSEDPRPDIQIQMSCSLVGGVYKKLWNMRGEVSTESISELLSLEQLTVSLKFVSPKNS